MDIRSDSLLSLLTPCLFVLILALVFFCLFYSLVVILTS
jgi:hypothetical protein